MVFFYPDHLFLDRSLKRFLLLQDIYLEFHIPNVPLQPHDLVALSVIVCPETTGQFLPFWVPLYLKNFLCNNILFNTLTIFMINSSLLIDLL